MPRRSPATAAGGSPPRWPPGRRGGPSTQAGNAPAPNLPIVVDGTDGFSWPWAWYLRDYREVRYDSPATPGYKPPEGAVLLINRANAKNVDVEGYTQTPYKHRWWFPETYRGLTPSKVKSIVTSWQSLKGLGSFFLHRRAPPPPGGRPDRHRPAGGRSGRAFAARGPLRRWPGQHLGRRLP